MCGAMERVVAILLVVLYGPGLLLIAGFIRTTSEGPVLITDQWLAGGRLVRAARFRTAGPGSGAFHLVGRKLRQYSLDELPALWNVVRGEVGLKDLYLFKR
jgi:lipopolysaccharide/colanic/teichoic acid biosynthesis glycosyltransferase